MFKVGDVVLLRSGGPAATVTATDDPPGVWIAYFDANDQLRDYRAPPAALIHIDKWVGFIEDTRNAWDDLRVQRTSGH